MLALVGSVVYDDDKYGAGRAAGMTGNPRLIVSTLLNIINEFQPEY